MKKEANLQLEVRRVRKVDLDKVSGGALCAYSRCRTTSECEAGSVRA